MLKVDRTRIKIRMIEKGIDTQKELAELAGINENTVGYFLRGKSSSMDTIQRLAGVLDLDWRELFVEEDGTPA